MQMNVGSCKLQEVLKLISKFSMIRFMAALCGVLYHLRIDNFLECINERRHDVFSLSSVQLQTTKASLPSMTLLCSQTLANT